MVAVFTVNGTPLDQLAVTVTFEAPNEAIAAMVSDAVIEVALATTTLVTPIC